MRKATPVIFALVLLAANVRGQIRNRPPADTSHKNVPSTTEERTQNQNNTTSETYNGAPTDASNQREKTNKSSFLERFLSAYLNEKAKDTVVPKEVYIPSTLIKHDILPTADAQELFLALNPKLYDLQQVHTMTVIKLPDFPRLEGQKKREYKASFRKGQTPDAITANELTKKVDSLNDLLVKIKNGPAEKFKMVEERLPQEFIYNLNEFSRRFGLQTNRVTVDWVSKLVSQMNLQLIIVSEKQLAKKQNPYSVITDLRNAIQELIPSTEEMRGATGCNLYLYNPEYFPANSKRQGYLLANIDESLGSNQEDAHNNFDNGLIPFEVVVWHYSKETRKPVTDDQDLEGKYEVYYCLQAYPNTIQTSPDNASTTGVNLPITKYLFWTKNIDTGIESKKMLIDTEDEFLKYKRKLTFWDRLVIPIKVPD